MTITKKEGHCKQQTLLLYFIQNCKQPPFKGEINPKYESKSATDETGQTKPMMTEVTFFCSRQQDRGGSQYLTGQKSMQFVVLQEKEYDSRLSSLPSQYRKWVSLDQGREITHKEDLDMILELQFISMPSNIGDKVFSSNQQNFAYNGELV